MCNIMWNLEDPAPQTGVGQILSEKISPEVGEKADKVLNALNELKNGAFESGEQIYNSFKNGSASLFTRPQADSIYRTLNKPMKGAGIITTTIEGLVQRIPFEGLSKYVFYLNELENTSMFKDLIASALDITAGVLPVSASLVQTGTQTIIGSIPIPFSGPVGIFFGWLFSMYLLWIAMLIGISRRDFGAAVEASAGMIPIFGQAAMRAVSAADRVATKLAARSDKVLRQITDAFGSAQNAIQQTTKVGGKRFTRRKRYTRKWKKGLRRSQRH